MCTMGPAPPTHELPPLPLIHRYELNSQQLLESPDKISWLQSIFRMAHTDSPGLAEAAHLPALGRYLHIEMSDAMVDAEMTHAAKRARQGGRARLGGMRQKRHLHFREFLHMVQRLSLIPHVHTLLSLCPPHEPHRPFPLIGITRAYFVGLYGDGLYSRPIRPQIYFEWTWKGLCDVPRLQDALNAFIARTPVWRAVVTPDGMMQVVRHETAYTIASVTPAERASAEQRRATAREMMAEGPDPFAWPLFECRVTHTPDGGSIMHLCVSLFIMDGISDLTLRRQLSALYYDLHAPLPRPSLLYKDYCLSLTGEDGGACRS